MLKLIRLNAPSARWVTSVQMLIRIRGELGTEAIIILLITELFFSFIAKNLRQIYSHYSCENP